MFPTKQNHQLHHQQQKQSHHLKNTFEKMKKQSKVESANHFENKELSQQQKKFNKIEHLVRSYDVKPFMTLIYTGGRVAVSSTENFFICCANKSAFVIEYETGQVISEFVGDEYIINAVLSPDDRRLVMSCRSLNTIIFSMSTKRELRVIRGANPVLEMNYDPTGTLIAQGCSDGSIKVYDSDDHYFTHHFQKVHTGKIQLVKFHPEKGNLHLFTSALDGLRCWNLETRKCIAILQKHSSVVTDIAFSEDGGTMVSSSRDNVLNVYTVSKDMHIQYTKCIPVYESIESLLRVPISLYNQDKLSSTSSMIVATAGSNGIIRVFDISKNECILSQSQEEKTSSNVGFIQMKYLKQHSRFMCATDDGNFLFYDAKTLEKNKQILGFNDEVLDVKYVGKSMPYLAVATNNDHAIIFNTETKNTEFLSGHTNIILALDSTRDGRFLITASKDQTIRVWDLSFLRCVAVGTSHTASVTAVAVAPKSGNFFVTCGDDKTMKLWNSMGTIRDHISKNLKKRKELSEKEVMPIICDKTCVAHQKDISCVTISQDEELIASSSSDKTVKIWDAKDLKLVHTFQHRMGVWSVAFSPVEQTVVTGCSDHLIRIWSLKTGSVVKILEGHEQAVMKVQFINAGLQLVTAGADGLIKIWTVKSGSCEESFDVHNNRVWGVAVRGDGAEMMTGGEDSKIVMWRENTKELVDEQRKIIDESIIKDQKLNNLIKRKKYSEAVSLAISLNKPSQVYTLLQQLLESTNQSDLNSITRGLSFEEVITLFQYIVDWNTNSRFSLVAQKMLNTIFNTLEPNFIPWSYEKSIDSLCAYSQRHFKRLESLIQQSYLLDFTLYNMKPLAPALDQESNSELSTKGAEEGEGLNTELKKCNLEDPELQEVSKGDEMKEIVKKIIDQSIQNKLESNEMETEEGEKHNVDEAVSESNQNGTNHQTDTKKQKRKKEKERKKKAKKQKTK